jgi:hypothetical protein
MEHIGIDRGSRRVNSAFVRRAGRSSPSVAGARTDSSSSSRVDPPLE